VTPQKNDDMLRFVLSNHFYDVLELLQCRSLAQLHEKTLKISNGLGFESFLYGMRIKLPGMAPDDFILSAYPDSWWQKYCDEALITVDPIMRQAFPGRLPYLWHEATNLNIREQHFMEEAKGHGLKTGVTMPVHVNTGEAGLLSLTRSDCGVAPKKEVVARLAEANLLAIYLHEALRNLISPEADGLFQQLPKLSPREMECLRWMCVGKSAWEVSVILAISEATVRGYLRTAYEKLGVSTQSQAIAKSVSFGLLTP
jgi:LuxR family transcriptional regulator, quorum-sensing system regulator LasR